ncbi:MAG: hypothetical protein IT376_17960 [Polyangiaceae bacterium]|nr:hypothetical protein [Polyangiaceae bacterium]
MQRSSPPTKFRGHGGGTLAGARSVLAAQAAAGLSAAAFAARNGPKGNSSGCRTVSARL